MRLGRACVFWWWLPTNWRWGVTVPEPHSTWALFTERTHRYGPLEIRLLTRWYDLVSRRKALEEKAKQLDARIEALGAAARSVPEEGRRDGR